MQLIYWYGSCLEWFAVLWLFHDGGLYHRETSPLISSTNKWTDFYMIGTSAMKELTSVKIKKRFFSLTNCDGWYFSAQGPIILEGLTSLKCFYYKVLLFPFIQVDLLKQTLYMFAMFVYVCIWLLYVSSHGFCILTFQNVIKLWRSIHFGLVSVKY